MEYGAVLVWWVLLGALAIAGSPIAATLFRALPDRGAALSLPVAIVVLFFPVYWLGHLTFGPPVVAVGAIVLAAVSAGLARRGPGVRWRRFAEGWAVFTAGFLLVVAVRAVDPSIYPAGGEKFLDFGLLNSLLRGTRLPPEDVWFAGEAVQYYYGGHLVAAVLTTLTGTAARYAYNLALAGFYGALVAAAYGVAGSIAATRGGPYRLAGFLGAVLVGFASNLVTPLQTLLWALPDGAAASVAAAVAGRTDLDAAGLLALSGGSRVPFYWIPSRVIEGTINEFPLFAFLNGDLHAHMMSTPFLLLVVGVAFAYFQTPAGALRRRRALVLGAVPPVAGLLAVVNTWSFPSAAGVTWLALVFAPADPREVVGLTDRLPADGPTGELGRIVAATVGAVVVALLGVLWVLPFFVGPATGASGRGLGLLPDRSGFVAFVLVHGTFVLVFGLYLGKRALPALGDRRDEALLAVLAALGVGLALDAAAVALVLPLLVAAWVLLRRTDGVGFEAVLFVAGAGLVLLVEFVFVSEQAGPGRMNTVFKTYMQVWVLWATGAAAALAWLSSRRPSFSSERRARAVRVVGVVLVLSTALYGAVALGIHFDGANDPTLDATRWARTAHADEWEAIRWLGGRPGQPTVVTAPGCWCNPAGTRPYDWVNAPSSFTGVPTVAGWSHEVGYRGREPYERRVEHVRTIYTGSPGERSALLREYDVRYLYVGPTERVLYGNVSFEGEDGIEVVREYDAVTIYRVDLENRRA